MEAFAINHAKFVPLENAYKFNVSAGSLGILAAESAGALTKR
jgi:hypothetical protein